MQQLSPLHFDGPRAGARSSLRKALRAALALGLLGASVSVGVTACGGGQETTGTTSGTGAGGGCVGGIVIDGKCEAKCTPDKCLPGNTCVDNACVLKCAAHTDCITGTQSCLPAKEDDTKADITVCTTNGLGPVGTPCPLNTECSAQTACPDGRSCDYTQCGGAVCARDEAACGADAACRLGACPDKTACVVPACPAAECSPLTCKTHGVGDALAYCTKLDCSDDTQCPGGYYCGITQDPHAICGLTPEKGNSSICGKTTEPCVDPATFGAGNTYFEGSVCLLRKECLRRDLCAACTTGIDCSIKGQHCVQSGAGNHCLRTCSKLTDCQDGTACVAGSCQPLYAGGCEGKGEFCAPCINDEDCGKKGTSMACVVVNDLTDERGCLDLSFSASCMVDADCPLSPGNRHGRCFSEANGGVGQTDPLYHRCYLPLKNGAYTCGK